MKTWTTLAFFIFCFSFISAQIKIGTYHDVEYKSQLILSENNYFQFQKFDGIFYHFLRGKWKIDNNSLILIESYYSDKSENLHFMFKLPKFDYTQANRITTFIINGNDLNLAQQEIVPHDAKFITEFSNQLSYSNKTL